jgi:hypothetical protein
VVWQGCLLPEAPYADWVNDHEPNHTPRI